MSPQRASDSGDSQLINVQAGGNTCPAELPDDPSSQRTRLWCCGHARSSFSMQSMPNNMQAGGHTCPAGPLDIAESLLNSPRRCGRLRIPDSFFSSSSLNSPVVVDGCVFLNPSSLFSPSKEPGCSYRRQVQSPSTCSGRRQIRSRCSAGRHELQLCHQRFRSGWSMAACTRTSCKHVICCRMSSATVLASALVRRVGHGSLHSDSF